MNNKPSHAIMTIFVAGYLAGQPAWSQVGEVAEAKAQESGVSDQLTKNRGDNAARKLGMSSDQLLFDNFTKAMQWELKTDQATTQRIAEVIEQFRSKDDHSEELQTDDELDGSVLEHSELKEAALKAAEDGDQGRFRELMELIPQKVSGARAKTGDLDPEMLYAIDALLKEPLRNDFWQIIARFTNKKKINPGGRFLDLLEGLQLSQKQGVAISGLYVNYMNATREAYQGDPEVLLSVRKNFQQQLMAELTMKQKVAFQIALKDDDRGDKRSKRESHSKW